MKIKLIIASLLTASASLFATGLSFSTSETVGQFVNSGGSTLADGSLFRFGTLSNTAVGLDIATYEAAFAQLGTASVASGEVVALAAPGTIAAGTTLYGIIYAGSSTADSNSSVFEIGTTPAFGLTIANPSTVSTMLKGTKSGNNIVVVPEPSTAGLIAGILALSSVMLRRRAA